MGIMKLPIDEKINICESLVFSKVHVLQPNVQYF